MRAALLTVLIMSTSVLAQLPPPPKDMAPWAINYPATLAYASAAAHLDTPAGRLGPVLAHDGHFYTGDRRIRFWGVNLAFAGDFPTHDEPDKLAARIAALGINADRVHHMDNQPF